MHFRSSPLQLRSFALVVTNLRAIEDRWAHAGRVSVYLKDSIGTPEAESLKAALASTPGVKAVRHVSATQARQDFIKQESSKGAIGLLPQEVFPASLEVEVMPEMSDAALADVVSKLGKLPGVDDVETYQAWTDRLARLTKGGVTAALLLALVVFASVLAVVGSTIRMALARRKTEVEVLRMVGATDRFIKGPFLVEGSAQGVMGASAAVVLLAALFFVVRGRLDSELAGLVGIEPTFLPWQLIVGLIVCGGALGAAAAMLGIRRLVAV
jgi:cell division transport system permease protein